MGSNNVISEFVWVPVATPVASAEADGTTNKAMAINLGTADAPQYRGLLYDFTGTTTVTSEVKSGCTTTTDSYREPAILSSSYDSSDKIRGSQYDAMLNWAINGADETKVTATSNASHDNSTNGAYRPGTQTVTGKTDKINNIYDLEGNVREWTIEANFTEFRVLRGGDYNDADSPSNRSLSSSPTSSSANYGSRTTLYIL